VVRDVPDDNETDVLAGKIAPGTQGSFSFKLENDSQVNATYTFKLTCTDATIPFTFTVGGNTYNYTQISTTGVTGELVMDAAATTITVDWVWPFEGTDDVDLELAGDTLNFTLTIDVTQVN
ncbi:MAG: hypothetical protein IKY59_00665, partial [Oscillospiraceae bacterium]|nr:hypothetical protein [Oscillospiraceae bacterium]